MSDDSPHIFRADPVRSIVTFTVMYGFILIILVPWQIYLKYSEDAILDKLSLHMTIFFSFIFIRYLLHRRPNADIFISDEGVSFYKIKFFYNYDLVTIPFNEIDSNSSLLLIAQNKGWIKKIIIFHKKYKIKSNKSGQEISIDSSKFLYIQLCDMAAIINNKLNQLDHLRIKKISS